MTFSKPGLEGMGKNKRKFRYFYVVKNYVT